MKRVKNFAKQLWTDESAQGATEYILLLVVVVAVVLVFKQKILEAVNAKLDELRSGMDSVTTQ